MIRLKRHLLLLVLGALVPLLALAVTLTVLLVREDRERTEQALHEHARLLSAALDAELSRSITAMQALSRSESLRRGELARFYADARDVRDSLGLWNNVLLLSPSDEHLFNLMRPFGTPLPPLPQPEGPLTATRTRQPYVSNALQGRVDTDWLMYMNYPVAIEGEVRYVIGVTMNSQYWSRWLTERAAGLHCLDHRPQPRGARAQPGSRAPRRPGGAALVPRLAGEPPGGHGARRRTARP